MSVLRPMNPASGETQIVHAASEGHYPSTTYKALFGSPEHIAASPDGSTVYATDLARNRVLVLAVTPPS